MKKYFIEGGLIFISVLASFFIESYRLNQSNIEIKNGLLVELSQIINEDLKQINKVLSIQNISLDASERLAKDYFANQKMDKEDLANNYLEVITNTPTSTTTLTSTNNILSENSEDTTTMPHIILQLLFILRKVFILNF